MLFNQSEEPSLEQQREIVDKLRALRKAALAAEVKDQVRDAVFKNLISEELVLDAALKLNRRPVVINALKELIKELEEAEYGRIELKVTL